MKLLTILLLIITNQALADEEELYAGWTLENCDNQATFERATLGAALEGISLTEYVKGIEDWRLKGAVARPKGYANALMAGRSLDALARENVIEKGLVECYEKVL
ncbi:uncharacterized protein METZ01_LOCUS495161, partial [marine metagenome]